MVLTQVLLQDFLVEGLCAQMRQCGLGEHYKPHWFVVPLNVLQLLTVPFLLNILFSRIQFW